MRTSYITKMRDVGDGGGSVCIYNNLGDSHLAVLLTKGWILSRGVNIRRCELIDSVSEA